MVARLAGIAQVAFLVVVAVAIAYLLAGLDNRSDENNRGFRADCAELAYRQEQLEQYDEFIKRFPRGTEDFTRADIERSRQPLAALVTLTAPLLDCPRASGTS